MRERWEEEERKENQLSFCYNINIKMNAGLATEKKSLEVLGMFI